MAAQSPDSRDDQWVASPLPERIGDYEVLDLLGSGQTGQVYLARRTGEAGFQRLYALKVLHPHLTADARAMELFFEEATIAARLHHHNVASIVDMAAGRPEYYVAMDYIEGCTLAELLERTGDYHPARLVTPIMIDLLTGLHAAHELRGADGQTLNLVHRDVSPHNVLLGTDGVGRMADFGIAKTRRQQEPTAPGQVRGRMGYSAPEQMMGKPMDSRADVFSAGVVLWTALTGQPLFEGANVCETLEAVLRLDVRPPSTVDPRVPQCLDGVCLKALQQDPADRYQTALEMAKDLRSIAFENNVLAGALEVGEWVDQTFSAELSARRRIVERAARGIADSSGTRRRDALPLQATDSRVLPPPPAPRAPSASGVAPSPRTSLPDVSNDGCGPPSITETLTSEVLELVAFDDVVPAHVKGAPPSKPASAPAPPVSGPAPSSKAADPATRPRIPRPPQIPGQGGKSLTDKTAEWNTDDWSSMVTAQVTLDEPTIKALEEAAQRESQEASSSHADPPSDELEPENTVVWSAADLAAAAAESEELILRDSDASESESEPEPTVVQAYPGALEQEADEEPEFEEPEPSIVVSAELLTEDPDWKPWSDAEPTAVRSSPVTEGEFPEERPTSRGIRLPSAEPPAPAPPSPGATVPGLGAAPANLGSVPPELGGFGAPAGFGAPQAIRPPAMPQSTRPPPAMPSYPATAHSAIAHAPTLPGMTPSGMQPPASVPPGNSPSVTPPIRPRDLNATAVGMPALQRRGLSRWAWPLAALLWVGVMLVAARQFGVEVRVPWQKLEGLRARIVQTVPALDSWLPRAEGAASGGTIVSTPMDANAGPAPKAPVRRKAGPVVEQLPPSFGSEFGEGEATVKTEEPDTTPEQAAVQDVPGDEGTEGEVAEAVTDETAETEQASDSAEAQAGGSDAPTQLETAEPAVAPQPKANTLQQRRRQARQRRQRRIRRMRARRRARMKAIPANPF